MKKKQKQIPSALEVKTYPIRFTWKNFRAEWLELIEYSNIKPYIKNKYNFTNLHLIELVRYEIKIEKFRKLFGMENND